ncbi:hypothetical protein ACSYAD_34440, partial [Acaryochloris marina NIES-2412]|uniref:hypothetical protein n=1 Tax=Acaryochloris marina TaxID=155978 RepID=UPI0040591D72
MNVRSGRKGTTPTQSFFNKLTPHQLHIEPDFCAGVYSPRGQDCFFHISNINMADSVAHASRAYPLFVIQRTTLMK